MTPPGKLLFPQKFVNQGVGTCQEVLTDRKFYADFLWEVVRGSGPTDVVIPRRFQGSLSIQPKLSGDIFPGEFCDFKAQSSSSLIIHFSCSKYHYGIFQCNVNQGSQRQHVVRILELHILSNKKQQQPGSNGQKSGGRTVLEYLEEMHFQAM